MQPRIRTVPADHPVEAQVQEPVSFETFFQQNHSRLFGALCLVTGNRQEAEEIAQDAFLKLWERWDRVSTLEDPTGFLFRTALNLFRNRTRRAVVAARRVVGLAQRSDDLAAVEDRDEMVRAMRRLTPQQRVALVLTGYLGYSSQEAAKILGVRASTVRALATKGRATARSTVEGRR
jgi:RNA polymerase sigma-70 factor (ECF subfamily)